MNSVHLKVARIGNSRGVRIPAPTLERYRIGDSVVMEERAWDETARAIANETEDWNAWDETLSDGLDQIPWESIPATRVGEKSRAYPATPRKRARSKK